MKKNIFFCTSSAVLLHSGGTIVVEMCNPVLNGKEKKGGASWHFMTAFLQFWVVRRSTEKHTGRQRKGGTPPSYKSEKNPVLVFCCLRILSLEETHEDSFTYDDNCCLCFLEFFSQKQKSFFLTKIMGLLTALSIIFLLVVVCIMHVFLWLNVKRKRKSGTVLENEIWSSLLLCKKGHFRL